MTVQFYECLGEFARGIFSCSFRFSSSCHSERYNDNIKIIFEKAGVTYLVSALTGHVEGSRAFNRYRDIDIDMKRDLVKIPEGKR